MTDQELSVIFERHAFDPWLPGNRQRNCLYVMDRTAFAAAVREAVAAKTLELVDVQARLAAITDALLLADKFGSRGEIEEDGERNGMSVSYFIDAALATEAKLRGKP